MSTSNQAVNLVSVNTAPERAKIVIGKVIEGVKDRYTIVHAGNSESEVPWTDGTRADEQQSRV